MLGLGNSITHPASISSGGFVFFKSLLSSSDFESLSTEGGNITFTEDVSTPDSIDPITGETVDGTGGWLKCVYPSTDQSNKSGISNSSFLAGAPQGGSSFTISFDIYLEDESKWGGTDDVLTHSLAYNFGVSEGVPPDQPVFYEDTSTGLSSNNNQLQIYWLTIGDLPKAGAVFYIKNLSFRINL